MERTPILLWAAHWTPISGTSCTKNREREREIKIEKNIDGQKEENIALNTKQIIRRSILRGKKENGECYPLLNKHPTNLRRIAH